MNGRFNSLSILTRQNFNIERVVWVRAPCPGVEIPQMTVYINFSDRVHLFFDRVHFFLVRIISYVLYSRIDNAFSKKLEFFAAF